MKTTRNKILLITVITIFQFCKSQDTKKYADSYNKNVPKLQSLAEDKKQFYNGNFSDFINEMEKKHIEIINYGYSGRTDIQEDIYILNLWLVNRENLDMIRKNDYQTPIILVYFKEQIPNELKILTQKYEGELSPEVIEFLADRKIEKIEFYGINGLKSTDRSVR